MPKVTQFGPKVLTDGDAEPARLNVRGDTVVMQSMQQWAFEGRVWQTTVGTMTTPVLGGGAGTILDADQPELVIDVPGGVVVAICNVRADLQPGVVAADADEFEALLAIDRTQVSGATATNGTVETPINFRTDIVSGSRVNVVSAVTTNLTAAPTLSMELTHPVLIGIKDGSAAATAYSAMLFMDYDPSVKPFVVGPATIVVYAGGTVATDIFCSAVWAEFTKTELGI